jgi:hypothetical protein
MFRARGQGPSSVFTTLLRRGGGSLSLARVRQVTERPEKDEDQTASVAAFFEKLYTRTAPSKKGMASRLASGCRSVVSGKAGPGLFALAKHLGRFDGVADEVNFWQQERQAVYETWKRPLHKL